jgi:epoxyqueuosine reductase
MRTSISSSRESLRDFIDREAGRLGFDCVAVASPDAIPLAAERLGVFVAAGHHGSMQWLSDTATRRGSPHALWPEVRSIVMLGVNYGPDSNPLDILARRNRGAISVYAQNRDYHDVVKGKLKQLAGKIAASSGADVKVFVDTAPVMEKPLAQASGLGWQGKHTNLVSREFGSWLFLGSIFTTAELEPDRAEDDRCGSCQACLDICPTNAFPAPYRLDARRCISYLTIESKGPIPLEFRAAIGNRIYGCDDCLAVCPWNKFARTASEAKLAARDDLRAPALADLLGLDDGRFRALFSGSPVKRIGRDRFLRNVLVAAGNSGDGELVAPCLQLLADPAPLVRGAAVWALSRLLGEAEFSSLAEVHAVAETDADVLSEWRNAAGAGLRLLPPSTSSGREKVADPERSGGAVG